MVKGIRFLEYWSESWSEREERESLERMYIEVANVEKIRGRQRGGKNLVLYINYLGHLRVLGEEDPDKLFCIQNNDSIWFPEPEWKSSVYTFSEV
jgi:hypothetical protein